MPSRQLLCEPCAGTMQRRSRHPEIVAAGETVRFVFGKSRRGYLCDDCGVPINEGERCAATTLFARGQTLGPWEADYIEPERTAPT